MSNTVEQRRIVLGVTGSIAAYKAAELARYLVRRGYDVRVVMTDGAMKFVSPMTFAALTGNPVTTSFWNEGDAGQIGHITLADWADAVVIAPASATTIARLATGMADCPLSAVVLATKSRIVLAPAMNVNMYEHPQTRKNLRRLEKRGVIVVEPERGDLACGWKGTGRLATPKEIFAYVRRALTKPDMQGKRVLVCTGPTREPIDPVRYISNRSSGKMGLALAMEAFRRGAHVEIVHGPISVSVPRAVPCHAVLSAEEMNRTVQSKLYPENASDPVFDIVVMAAAVADYRPAESSPQKIKKHDVGGSIDVVTNPDILRELGERKGGSRLPVLVGFAVETGETEDLLSEVSRKLVAKNADIIVGNKADDAFEGSTNHVWIMTRSGKVEEVSMTFKSRIATKVFDVVTKF
jgi:phosphopantothenoylcysteine decarboxylase / phosphopantothenate---cysteine ligase